MKSTESTAASNDDLIDRIAKALPVDVRADYYRELNHCRSLPEHDEMLRILRAMQFLTLLMNQVPQRVAAEGAVDLVPQMSHVDIDDVGTVVQPVVPRVLEQP